MTFDIRRRLVAEILGTAILVATVVGSGIMADRLSADTAVSLLGNTIPTGAILVVLITIFGPISGAHFNPVVTIVFSLRREIKRRDAATYVLAQLAGGIAGTWVAHLMFDLPIFQISETVRTGDAAVDRGGGRGFRPGSHHSLRAAVSWGRGAVACRPLHHCRLLVHRVDLVRQSGGRDRTLPYEHVLRHSSIDLPGFALAEIAGALLAIVLAGWLLAAKSGPSEIPINPEGVQ